MAKRVTLLSGGVGGSKLAQGLYTILPIHTLSIIANCGDDINLFGLRICPDLDILTYTLAGLVEESQGWGIKSDSHTALNVVKKLGGTDWFTLGDNDLGLHLWRTEQLKKGRGLTAVTATLSERVALNCNILPMSNQYTPTMINTDKGEMHIQEYLVRYRTRPVVKGLRYAHAEKARPAPGLARAIELADVVIIGPSNPLISIGPILAIPGIREALRKTKARRIGVCPLVGGKALKGPTDRMMQQLGHESNPATVAGMYRDILDEFVIDKSDEYYQEQVEANGLICRMMPTIMNNMDAKQKLARELLKPPERA